MSQTRNSFSWAENISTKDESLVMEIGSTLACCFCSSSFFQTMPAILRMRSKRGILFCGHGNRKSSAAPAWKTVRPNDFSWLVVGYPPSVLNVTSGQGIWSDGKMPSSAAGPPAGILPPPDHVHLMTDVMGDYDDFLRYMSSFNWSGDPEADLASIIAAGIDPFHFVTSNNATNNEGTLLVTDSIWEAGKIRIPLYR